MWSCMYYISGPVLYPQSLDAKTLHRKLETNTVFPEMKLLRPRSQFLHPCICEWFIYTHDRSAYMPAAKFEDQSWEYINRSQKHECGNWKRGRADSYLRFHKSDLVSSVKLKITSLVFTVWCPLSLMCTIFKKDLSLVLYFIPSVW